jgi:hypothetical protein
MALCSLYVNRRFGGRYHLHLQGLKTDRVRSQRAAGARPVYRCENLKSYIIHQKIILCGDTDLEAILSHDIYVLIIFQIPGYACVLI